MAKKQIGVNKELQLAEKYGVMDMISKPVMTLAKKAQNREDFGWVEKVTSEMIKEAEAKSKTSMEK